MVNGDDGTIEQLTFLTRSCCCGKVDLGSGRGDAEGAGWLVAQRKVELVIGRFIAQTCGRLVTRRPGAAVTS
jgi:hypothetical protein